ncbi:chromosomal replication initiator protein DnaA [Treponema primitia]|uniref:chromosomal replication initiator protein DnaA n=1 Tax=Treponema primitia TaxID=88058 RepID=UPI00398125C6
MANGDYDIIWKETMNQIREELGEQEFTMWFNLEYLDASENELTIGVPSTFYQDQVRQRYQLYIEGKIRDLIGKNLTINFIVNVRSKEESPTPPTGGEKRTAVSSAKPVSGTETKKRHSQLREDYTFDTYIIGDNNHFAANAAQAIALNPGTTSYNPLLIYGGVGLGKTHLMQAIGNEIHKRSESKIIYITAETFTNEFIQSVRENKTATFKNKYRFVDVLLIDDIHFLQKKIETQEELFHTFNALYDANKQIVFTCDRPVTELKDFSDRLQSRVGRGLNVDLQPPKYETRFAILKKKIETHNITIPDEVIELISRNVSTNIRDLESAMNKLVAYTDIIKKPVTLEIAQEQLRDNFTSPKQSNLSIEIIQREVADYYRLSLIDLKGKKRTQSIVFPRQLAMYIARKLTDYSTIEIGQSFGGRDHATVIHSCDKIEGMIRADPKVDSEIQNIMRAIKTHGVKN